MDCSDQEERALAYLTGKLSQDQAGDYHRHLDHCASCRARHAEEAELLAAFDLPTEGLAGEALVSAVMADVAALPGRTRPERSRGSYRRTAETGLHSRSRDLGRPWRRPRI